MNDNKKLTIQPIKGFIQEARSYLSYPFHTKRSTTKKFVILCIHRSGSSLLVNLLDSHPAIHCEYALLYYRKMFPLKYIECRNRLSPKEIFGFKLMPNHIGYQGIRDAGQFMTELNYLGFLIVKLTRRNLLRAAISLISAQKRGKFHYKQSEMDKGVPKFSIDPLELMDRINWLEQLVELQEQILKPLPHLELVYEEHLFCPDQHQTTINMITDYLGVPSALVHSDFAKISAENTGEYISNFDEIAAMLQGTNAVKYLQYG